MSYTNLVSKEQATAFYKSVAWVKCREYILSRDMGLCQYCVLSVGPVPASIVHHIIHLRNDWSKRLDEKNLISVCATCHNKLHPEKSKGNSSTGTDDGVSKRTNSKIKIVKVKANPNIF